MCAPTVVHAPPQVCRALKDLLQAAQKNAEKLPPVVRPTSAAAGVNKDGQTDPLGSGSPPDSGGAGSPGTAAAIGSADGAADPAGDGVRFNGGVADGGSVGDVDGRSRGDGPDR
jgi:hypothetical protein